MKVTKSLNITFILILMMMVLVILAWWFADRMIEQLDSIMPVI